MKKVEYEYGCPALGYHKGEMYVPEDMAGMAIEQQIKNEAKFGIYIHSMEDGYEEVIENTYRRKCTGYYND